ncbi:hypothetical protein BH09BAC2_BH09BAC2_08340 [soil metagenome]
MNIQKIKTALVIFCISLSFTTMASPLGTDVNATTENPVSRNPVERLYEIRDMNKENLSVSEKKELKKEVKELRKEIRSSKNGLYLSIGAILIIVLILILIL